MPVHLYGMSAKLEQIKSIAKKNNLFVIEVLLLLLVQNQLNLKLELLENFQHLVFKVQNC